MIFGNHVAAVGLIILYIPYIYSAVIGFLHFAAFLALVIVNIFIKDAEPGNGSRTKVSRLLWGSNLCILCSHVCFECHVDHWRVNWSEQRAPMILNDD